MNYFNLGLFRLISDLNYRKILVALSFFVIGSASFGQDVIPLYKGEIKGAIQTKNNEKVDTVHGSVFVRDVSRPTLSVFLPLVEPKNNAAVIICPGGGYQGLSMTGEGSDIARAFNKIGVAAFVLKYRLPSPEIMIHTESGPLQDVQAAIKLVRQKYGQFNIDTNRVGVIGFSAGGHLAAALGTHFNDPVIRDRKNENLRPDFMILLYPVISMQDNLTHWGSRNNMLGRNPADSIIDFYSNELQVTSNTPPTFLTHAQDDKGVSVQNSLVFYNALTKNNVPAEMHIYQNGGHGFGLNNKTTDDKWFERCKNWMLANNWISLK